MEAKELRVGNIINQGVDGIAEVSGYGIYQLTVTENGGIQYCKDWGAIRLTEEWIFKFGFKRVFNGIGWDTFEYDKFKLVEVPTNKGKILAYDLGSGGYKYIVKVHSLQNLYFAVTGKELTIKN